MRLSAIGRIVIWMLPTLLLCPNAARAAAPESLQIPAELWDRPRSGAAFLGTSVVKQAINMMLARPQAAMVIRHPPGAETTLSAEELRAWFVAHAIEPSRVTLRADLPPRSALLVEIGH